MSTATPKPDKKVAYNNTAKNLTWETVTAAGTVNDPVRYVVYRFPLGTTNPDFGKSENIVAVTGLTNYPAEQTGDYYVTVLNHVNNESTPSKPVSVKR